MVGFVDACVSFLAPMECQSVSTLVTGWYCLILAVEVLNFVPLAQVQAVHNIVASSVVYFSITTPLRPIHDSPVNTGPNHSSKKYQTCSLGVSLVSLVLQLAMSCCLTMRHWFRIIQSARSCCWHQLFKSWDLDGWFGGSGPWGVQHWLKRSHDVLKVTELRLIILGILFLDLICISTLRGRGKK